MESKKTTPIYSNNTFIMNKVFEISYFCLLNFLCDKLPCEVIFRFSSQAAIYLLNFQTQKTGKFPLCVLSPQQKLSWSFTQYPHAKCYFLRLKYNPIRNQTVGNCFRARCCTHSANRSENYCSNLVSKINKTNKNGSLRF